MRMDGGPPVSWGRLLPLQPAAQPSGSPSPVPWDRGKEGTKDRVCE